MFAWQLDPDQSLHFRSLPELEPVPEGVLVTMQAAPVLSYMRQVFEGNLPYALAPRPFVPGTNGDVFNAGKRRPGTEDAQTALS